MKDDRLDDLHLVFPGGTEEAIRAFRVAVFAQHDVGAMEPLERLEVTFVGRVRGVGLATPMSGSLRSMGAET